VSNPKNQYRRDLSINPPANEIPLNAVHLTNPLPRSHQKGVVIGSWHYLLFDEWTGSRQHGALVWIFLAQLFCVPNAIFSFMFPEK